MVGGEWWAVRGEWGDKNLVEAGGEERGGRGTRAEVKVDTTLLGFKMGEGMEWGVGRKIGPLWD